MNKAFFFDRDGIIVKMVFDEIRGNTHSPWQITQIEFVPGIFKLLALTKKLGYLNITISNQPDVALGKISLVNFLTIQKKINSLLSSKNLALDKEYYCFHHPFAKVKKYQKKCSCRKPQPYLIFKAAKEFHINLHSSWMIGDGVWDIIAGHNAGCKTILVTNFLESENLRILESKLQGIKPDLMVKKISDVIDRQLIK